MAAILHKLLRKPPSVPSLPLLRALGTPKLPPFSPPLLQDPTQVAGRASLPLYPLPDGEGDPPSFLHQPLLILPTFPLMHLLDPIYQPRGSGLDGEKGDGVDERTLWADSVKKKRKRKMNKHKLRKLRRMLRRKT